GDAWGNLTGRFVLDGDPPQAKPLTINKDADVCGKHNLVDESLKVGSDGSLEDIVVFAATRKLPVHQDYEAHANDKVQFDNEHCRFEPHILPMVLTQTLVLHNSDPV